MKLLPKNPPLGSTQSATTAQLNQGVSNGVEIAGVLLVFFFIGFGLDHWLGTRPWFMVGFTVVGIVGIFVRAWYGYSAEMDRLDAERKAPRVPQAGANS